MISAASYQEILCILDQASLVAESACKELIAMLAVLNSMSVSQVRSSALSSPVTTLRDKIYTQYLGVQEELSFLAALQNHVKTHYGSVSQFIIDNNIVVTKRMSILSQSIGYAIPQSHIGLCS